MERGQGTKLRKAPLANDSLNNTNNMGESLTNSRPTLTLKPVTAAGLPTAPGGPSPAGSSLGEGPKLRASFYVDGFNLYHAINDLGDPHLKWVDLKKLCGMLLNHRRETLETVYWCSAIHHQHSPKRDRHRTYRRAIESTGVKSLLGHFVEEQHTCKASCRRDYLRDAEKQGDLNVALQLIRDGYADSADIFFLVSADSDQAATARVFSELFPTKQLISVAPPGRAHSKHILKYAHGDRSIFEETVANCLLPEEIVELGSIIAKRPVEYAPPLNWSPPPLKASVGGS